MSGFPNGLHTNMEGLFYLVEGGVLNGHPFYVNSQNQYLYHGFDGNWHIGDPSHSTFSIRTVDSKVGCPDTFVNWQIQNSGLIWIDHGEIRSTCGKIILFSRLLLC